MLYLTVKPNRAEKLASGYLFLGCISQLSQCCKLSVHSYLSPVSCLWGSPANCIASETQVENK